jgi:hypothetical protein
VQTTVDIDGALLRQAEQQAKRQGKSLGALLEDALRAAIQSSVPDLSNGPGNEMAEGLEIGDPFFTALDEIRALGRAPAQHRNVDFR